MIRTVISLAPDAKAWLDDQARETGRSMTDLVREAVERYRVDQTAARRPSREQLLARTRGTWTNGDGLAWQRAIRADWDHRPSGAPAADPRDAPAAARARRPKR
jgi:hypothetical protein